MTEKLDWEIPAEARPRPEDFAFDLDRALASVLRIESAVPEDAFSAATLGTERLQESGTDPLLSL